MDWKSLKSNTFLVPLEFSFLMKSIVSGKPSRKFCKSCDYFSSIKIFTRFRPSPCWNVNFVPQIISDLNDELAQNGLFIDNIELKLDEMNLIYVQDDKQRTFQVDLEIPASESMLPLASPKPTGKRSYKFVGNSL